MVKNALIIVVWMLLLASCNTKYNYLDSGLANGKFDGNLYEYLHSSAYDWDSTLLLVERAGLEDLFEGRREGFENVTFFGPTNLSIIRWMIKEGYERIEDISVDVCKEIILRHVVAGVYERDDIPRGEPILGELQGVGGVVMTSAWGSRLWIYSHQNSYQTIQNVGPVVLYIVSLDKRTSINVASTNIEVDNGMVHSLQYDYTLGEL